MKSTHINLVLAAEVASGRAPSTTPVGKAIDADGKWYTGFIAFDKATGAPVISEKTGSTKINWRSQG